jgi:hypothetical protein
VLRLGVAIASGASEAAARRAARVVGDADQRPVGEPGAACVKPGGEALLDAREQLDEQAQPAVVLRLVLLPTHLRDG